MNSDSIEIENIIKRAESFLTQNPGNKALDSTFGYFTHHPFSPLNQKRLKTILQIIKNRAPERVLDIACGGGLVTSAIAAMDIKTLGVDINPEEIRLAEMFTKNDKNKATFLLLDMITDPNWESQVEKILGGKPQAIVLAYALHHLPHVEIFLKRLGQWMEPDTILIINEENPLSPTFRLKHALRTWIQKDTETEWHKSFRRWKKLLEQSGFNVSHQVTGLDMAPLVGTLIPHLSWSLVFTAYKR